MKHLANGLFLAGTAILLTPLATLGGCSDDDGNNVPPKPPITTAGSGGQAGSGGSAGTGGAAAGTGGGGNGGTGSMLDAGMQGDMCTPVFLDAGVVADAGNDAGGDAGDGGPIATNGPVSFAADIYPILTANCVPCHATDYSGGHNVASPDEAEAYGFAQDLKGTILERVNGGNMPPDCYGAPGSPNCLSVAEVDLIRRWSAQCFPP
jgi:hypothetical protein